MQSTVMEQTPREKKSPAVSSKKKVDYLDSMPASYYSYESCMAHAMEERDMKQSIHDKVQSLFDDASLTSTELREAVLRVILDE